MHLSLRQPTFFPEIHPLQVASSSQDRCRGDMRSPLRSRGLEPMNQADKLRALRRVSAEGISPEDPGTPLAGRRLSPPPTQPLGQPCETLLPIPGCPTWTGPGGGALFPHCCLSMGSVAWAVQFV